MSIFNYSASSYVYIQLSSVGLKQKMWKWFCYGKLIFFWSKIENSGYILNSLKSGAYFFINLSHQETQHLYFFLTFIHCLHYAQNVKYKKKLYKNILSRINSETFWNPFMQTMNGLDLFNLCIQKNQTKMNKICWIWTQKSWSPKGLRFNLGAWVVFLRHVTRQLFRKVRSNPLVSKLSITL